MTVSRWIVAGVAVVCLASAVDALAQAQVRYVRYEAGGRVAWGILDNETTIRELQGSVFDGAKPTGRTVRLADVKLLAPAEPKKVIAAGLNYRSHIGQASPAKYVGLFAKFPTSLIGHEGDIIYPADATTLHYEAEICVVIGKKAQNISEAQARSHIFGVTPCNDVSERGWQKQDLQWFRAKASDTFGPLGPVIVKGLNYGDLLLQTRLNGEVVQSQRTKDLIFDVPTIVSYVSRFVTLEPGDVIYTGTPGTTRRMNPGDTVEIEIEGIGVLRNKVKSEK